MDLDIQGLRVLVTAGANGIGREIARAFIGEGASVHVCDVDKRELTELARTDPKITSSLADVADRVQGSFCARRWGFQTVVSCS